MEEIRYERGAHTVLDLQYHLVWKTKYGYPVLKENVGKRVRSIIREICEEKGIGIIRGNVRPDHVHVLVRAPAHMSVAKIAQYLKGKSSYKLQREFKELRKQYWGRKLWSRGYFCSTVGAVTEETVKAYIENQKDAPKNFQVWDEAPFKG